MIRLITKQIYSTFSFNKAVCSKPSVSDQLPFSSDYDEKSSENIELNMAELSVSTDS